MANAAGKPGKWARTRKEQLGEALIVGAVMKRQEAQRDEARAAAVRKRELAVFDCYAGLRRLTFTDEGARAKLTTLGVRPAEVEAAAAKYRREGAMTRRMWTSLAKRWATTRWCWDDCAEDIKRRADMDVERPDEFIDRMAERWGLEDPSDPWGLDNGQAVEQLRAIIVKRWNARTAAAAGTEAR